MGKLTVKQAEELVSKGILEKDTLESMQSEGLVSQRRNSTRRYIKTSEGNWVQPMFYFAGLKGKSASKKMNQLRDEINTLIDKHTVVRQHSKQETK